MADDIITHFVRRLEAYTTPEEARRVEIDLRLHWGGAEVYVQKVPTLQKAAMVFAGIDAGLTLREAFDAAGVSRATGYRLMSRRWR